MMYYTIRNFQSRPGRGRFAPALLALLLALGAGIAHAQTGPAGLTAAAADSARKAREAELRRWQEYRQAESKHLDDGFLFSFGVGLSPSLIHARTSGGNTTQFPDVPPFPEVNFRGMGGMVDVKVGWLVENAPYLKDYWFGEDRLHDQLYLTLDFIARATPAPQWRFAGRDTAETFLKPYIAVDLIGGVGTTYLVYPYGVSVSTTVGLGVIGMQGSKSSMRTNIGPAVNVRVGQEWSIRENWRSGFAVNYGFLRAINPQQIDDDGLLNYREAYSSHLFSIQWINSVTPPKFRRPSPPVHGK